MNNRSTYIIIPIFNEASTIRPIVASLLDLGYSVILVDDDSTDATPKSVEGLSIYYLKHEVNLGQGAAIQTGVEYALRKDNAQVFVTFDGDGQHRVEDISELIKPIENDSADIVFGSRFLPQSSSNASAGRKLAIHFARFINFIFSGILLSDAHNGLRAFNRKTASVLNLKENGMAHASEILFSARKNKLRITEVPVQISYTEYSIGKGQSVFAGIRIFLDIIFNRIFD